MNFNMGFLKDLGNICLDSTKSGIANGILGSLGANSRSTGDSPFEIINNIDLLLNRNDLDFSGTLTSKEESSNKEFRTQESLDEKNNGLNNKTLKGKVKTFFNDQIINDDIENLIDIKIPNWGYKHFVNERLLFKKHMTGIFSEPGSFHFRIFFDFDTQNGLFGGLLNNLNILNTNNSAGKYLKVCSIRYSQEKLNERLDALQKFASILSFINANAPWFFMGIKGLDKSGIPLIKNFTKEKSIILECNTESIDMRLTTLFDLYKYAIYDEILCKEIIPDNLRKFSMRIIIFQTPIRPLHTFSNYNYINKNNIDKIKFKQETNLDDLMSFKMFEFHNCEFDIESLGSSIPNSIKNDKYFTLGSNEIKINYDKVYQYTSNEYFQILFGSTGYYYNNYSLLQDFTTSKRTYIYEKRLKDYKNFKFKFVDDISILESLGVDFILKLFGSSKKSGVRLGSIYDPYDKGPNSGYFKRKIESLKNGIKPKHKYIYNNENIKSLQEKIINNNLQNYNIYNIDINDIIKYKYDLPDSPSEETIRQFNIEKNKIINEHIDILDKINKIEKLATDKNIKLSESFYYYARKIKDENNNIIKSDIIPLKIKNIIKNKFKRNNFFIK